MSARNDGILTTGGSRVLVIGSRRQRVGIQRMAGNGFVAFECHRSRHGDVYVI